MPNHSLSQKIVLFLAWCIGIICILIDVFGILAIVVFTAGAMGTIKAAPNSGTYFAEWMIISAIATAILYGCFRVISKLG